MENKPQNVFDKLDKQGKQIDDIASKLEGISVNDLYALAKRTWDYGDFETAQKYYNHISLLKPLDWEAPFYASLCNFGGYHNIIFWATVPAQKEKIIISTIDYINKLEADMEKKDSEMSKCIEIAKSELLVTKKHYFDYKDNYESHDNNFIFTLDDLFLNIYLKVNNLKYNCINGFRTFLADNLLDIIYKTQKISSNVSRDLYNELINLSTNKLKIDYDELATKSKSIQALSPDEDKQIKLQGKLFYEYDDKNISKRILKRRLIIGIIFLLFSIPSIVICSFYFWPFVFSYIIFLIYGFIILVVAFSQKERINCYSQLCMKRKKTRLTSYGDVVIENRMSFIKIFVFLSLYIGCLAIVYTIIGSFGIDANLAVKVFLILSASILLIFNLLSFFEMYVSNSGQEGSYYYRFNGIDYPAKRIY